MSFSSYFWLVKTFSQTKLKLYKKGSDFKTNNMIKTDMFNIMSEWI